MVKNVNTEFRKTLLVLSNKLPPALNEFIKIRGNYKQLNESLDMNHDVDKTIKFCVKKNANMFMTYAENSNLLTFGRYFDKELVDLVKFNIIESKDSKVFNNTLAPEISSKNMLIVIGLSNKRLENLFIDILNHRSTKVNLLGLHYGWRLCEMEEKDIFELSYVRIMNDCTYELIGPVFTLKVVEYKVNEEIFTESLEKRKNTSCTKKGVLRKNSLKNVVASVVVGDQNLSKIRNKKF